MENRDLLEQLLEGGRKLGLALEKDDCAQLLRLQDELLRWNRKVNLTSIVEPNQVVEKHLLDSLMAVRFTPVQGRLLDLGAGAGFPSLPVAVVRRELEILAVDSVAKKVSFIKHVSAALGLGRRVQALHRRAAGQPSNEGIPLADVVISRALMDLSEWLALARCYVVPGGRAIAMLGRKYGEQEVARLAQAGGGLLREITVLTLPFSGAERTVASFSW